ncbi:MAG: D-2-hydroxyacid dehydrogenase [Caldilineaceae bacterium]|nr:D-2-hydroxyacid dehydrogenase [Caldilineaceae bacterium]
MNYSSSSYNLLIASYLEPEHVARIRQTSDRLNVLYAPDLLAPPRYPADHFGGPFQRTPEEEAAWQGLLAQADILFDFDHSHRVDLPELAPRVRWIQATSAGIGQFVKRMGYAERMPNTIFTTASGVHARPLAEYCMMAMLMHYKRLRHILAEQEAHHWEGYAGSDLEGRTLAVVGLGRIGREVARMGKCLGMRTVGTRARGEDESVDRFYPPHALHAMLGEADAVVAIVPHTPETEGMFDAAAFSAMKPGAFFINIARGQVVDEEALISALRSGRLSGAALDVFATEPLPPESPLWDMENVLVSSHSVSNSDRENARVTDLFCTNLRRYLAGEPLENVLDTERLY